MSDQICKGCLHDLKFHYKAFDGQVYCIECNSRGRDCFAFDEQ